MPFFSSSLICNASMVSLFKAVLVSITLSSIL